MGAPCWTRGILAHMEHCVNSPFDRSAVGEVSRDGPAAAVDPAGSAAARIAALRDAAEAAAREDLDRASEGLGRRIGRVEAAKDAFDANLAHRFDKSARAWAAIAQTVYAGDLDDADAARRGETPAVPGDGLAPRPEFQVLAGEGVLSVRPGSSGRHRVAWRAAPGAEPSLTGEVLRREDRTCRLVEASPASVATPALRGAVEAAAASVLAEPWREALCALVDRCTELSMYATLVAAPCMRAASVPSQGTVGS